MRSRRGCGRWRHLRAVEHATGSSRGSCSRPPTLPFAPPALSNLTLLSSDSPSNNRLSSRQRANAAASFTSQPVPRLHVSSPGSRPPGLPVPAELLILAVSPNKQPPLASARSSSIPFPLRLLFAPLSTRSSSCPDHPSPSAQAPPARRPLAARPRRLVVSLSPGRLAPRDTPSRSVSTPSP